MPHKVKIPPAQMPLLNRAAIYTRVSTEDQIEGYGLDVQTERCRAQAIAKGWKVVAEFSDPGISGTKGASERPALSALLEAAQKREIDTVIVLALDRLGRKTALVLSLIEQLAQSSVDLVSCKESLDTSTPQGRFVLTMFAALAELERDVIVQRTSAGRDERGKKDGERGGRIPYGYIRLSNGTVAIDENAARVVQHIFVARAGNKTLTTIAEELNIAGITPARAGQKRYSQARWYASTIKSVLQNEAAYRGNKRGESAVEWKAIL